VPVEPVDEQGGQQASQRRAECVSRDDQTELPWANAQRLHQPWAQRHDDHEIDDVDELRGRQH
jgi:hypothetical protein